MPHVFVVVDNLITLDIAVFADFDRALQFAGIMVTDEDRLAVFDDGAAARWDRPGGATLTIKKIEVR